MIDYSSSLSQWVMKSNTEYIVGDVMCKHFSKILIILLKYHLRDYCNKKILEISSNPLFYHSHNARGI